MPSSRKKGSALLDSLRRRHGNGRLPELFSGYCGEDTENALRLINDGRLRFPSLYLLRHEIASHGLHEGLSARNAKALELLGLLTVPVKAGAYKALPEQALVLDWMLRTGHAEENLGSAYDRALDFCAILLSREHRDRACLPVVASLLFARRRKGSYTHDAEWALFESRDPACLGLVARRLLSRSGSDVELARRLLGFIPCFDATDRDAARQYRCVSRWLAHNRGRLRYTGLGSQQGPNPKRFEVVEDAGEAAK